MATISAPDLVKLRTQQQYSVGYLSILQPEVLLTAVVTGGPARGARSVSYNTGVSSSFSTIEAGQTIVFSTTYGLQRGRVKAISGTAANGTITLDENGFLLTNGDSIVIYHNYEVHPIPPAIRSQIFYKFYDLVYGNQNSQPNPIAIAGPHKVGWLTINALSPNKITVDANDGYVYPALPPGIFPTGSISFGAYGPDEDTWFRFTNVQIPNAAIITSATITLISASGQSSTVALNIYGEDADNPTAPTTVLDYSGRTTTTALVAWAFSTAWTGGQSVSTPDLSTIVQEIVNRGGWASGNALQIFIKNDGGAGSRTVLPISATLNISYVTPETFSLSGSNSYAIASGATISSYLWSCIHNGGAITGISFSATNVANPTLTISEVGQYWLKLTVTDSNGKTQSTYRALWVYDRSGSLLPYLDFTVQSLSGDWTGGGWKCSLAATGDLELSELPDYALVVISCDNFFNGVEDYVNLFSEGDNVIIAGYLRQDGDNDDFKEGTGNATFQITTIDDLLNNVCELGTVSLNAVSNPTKWYEYASWMIAGRSIHHLIKWHSWGVLETCDILGLTDNTLGVKNTDYSESSLMQQVNVFSYQRGIFAKLMSNRLGQMYLVADSQMLNTAGRAALDTIFTITTADISGTIDVVRSPEETVVFAQLDGFAFNGSASTPYVSIIPGYRESSVSYIIPNQRGSSIVNISNQVLASQTDANEKVGRYVALQNNNPRELRFSTPGNYLGCFDIIPSLGWYEWGISDVSLKRNLELNGKLFVCRNVSHTLDFQSGVIQTSVVLEKEAIGPDGIVGNYPTGYPTVALPTPSWDSGQANTSLADFLFTYATNSASSYYCKAGRYSGGTISLTATGQQICANTNSTSVLLCGLSSTKGLALYFKVGAGISARTINVDSSTLAITLGGEQVIDALGTTPYSIVALSNTIALAVYDETVIVLSISGDTITLGGTDAFEVGALGIWLTRLSSTLACAAYFLQDDVVKAVSISVSGTTPTINTPQDITSTGIGSLISTNIISLDNTTAIVLYMIAQEVRALSIYNITTSFTVGSDIQLVAADANPGGGNGLPYGTQLLSTELPYIWLDGSAVPYVIKANSITYSGSGNISDGTEMTASNGADNRGLASIVAISNNRMAIVYPYDDGVDRDVYVRTLNYDGSINDDNNEEAVDSGMAYTGANTSAIAQLRTP